MRPADLVQKVRSIALSSSGGRISLDDYEVDDEDDGKGWERTEILVEQLGAEVINDEGAFTSLLPEIFSGSGRLISLGSGFGSGTQEPIKHWRSLTDGLAALPANRRNLQVLNGFLRGVSARNPEIAASLLDAAVTDATLGPRFPTLQCAVPIDKRGVDRLRRSLELGIAPMSEYRSLAWGRSHETVATADLRALVSEIGKKPDGVEPALEIVFYRLFSNNQKQQPHDPETIEVGRELLVKLEFSETSDRDDHNLRQIVGSCLAGTDGAAAARVICDRFKDVAVNAAANVHHYNDFFGALCKTQPMVVLDTFFTGSAAEQRAVARMLQWFGGHRPNPLDAIPDDVLIEWCNREPDPRYLAMAGFVSFLRGSEEEDTSSHWSSGALKVIQHAPDQLVVVQKFAERFRPSGWSGSLASILEGRKALFEDLKVHENPAVAAFANEEAARFADEVVEERRCEAEDDRRRDERFE